MLAVMVQLFELTGAVALVTGGNGGLGLAMARGLRRTGAQPRVPPGRPPVRTSCTSGTPGR